MHIASWLERGPRALHRPSATGLVRPTEDPRAWPTSSQAHRLLLRVVINTADDAEGAADRLVQERRPFERAVWARHGRLRGSASELVASDAILVAVFGPDGSRTHGYGLPYLLGPTGAQVAGSLHTV
jgi:hypothetical protein